MAENEVSAIHRALTTLFTTLTPEQVQNFLQEMNASSTATSGSNLAVVPKDKAQNSLENLNLTSMPMAGNGTARGSSPRGKRLRDNGKLRPLNSFIAFRSMY
jgi:hypothetical protein